ncbi:MAG TPA: hypothetical protein VK119_12620 [Bacillota bacterium]|nr:hypothetical protein [Bacillota bacterium]
MRKFILLLGSLFLAMMLAACSSEADEIVDYHNGYIENVADRMDEMDEMGIEALNDEEVLGAYEDELLPFLTELKDYMDSQDELEHDVTKEYHALRKDAIDKLHEGFHLHYEALSDYDEGSITEEELFEKIAEIDEVFLEAEESTEAAEERIDELSDEYDLEELDDDDE